MNHIGGLLIFDNVIVRAAGMSNINFKYDNLAQLLKDSSFQAAILFASKSLFKEIEKHNFEFDRVSEKAKISLSKYYNRYCYRVTPFGLFSFVGTALWSQTAQKLRLFSKPEINFQIASAYTLNFFLTYFPLTHSSYFLNQTIYAHYNEFRFYTLEFSKELEINFKLNAVKKSKILYEIFDFLKKQRTYAELVDFSGDGYRDMDGLVNDLINSGIIIPSYYPTMTDFNYSDRLRSFQILNHHNYDEVLYSHTKRHLQQWKNLKSINSITKVLNTTSLVSNDESNMYVNMVHPIEERIPASCKDQLTKIIRCLSVLYRIKDNPSIEGFKSRFSERFGNTRQSLMSVLDPELGVGYLIPENASDEQLGKKIRLEKATYKSVVAWTDVHEFFIDKFLEEGKNGINITEKDLEQLNKQCDVILPPSFSISFSKVGEEIVVNYVGGASASNIASRFTFDENIYTLTKEIAETEERNNPRVKFAEIVCLTDGKVLDINTKKNVYSHQIPLFVSQSNYHNNCILPSEIDIQVIDGRIVLTSNKDHKEIIPRFNSVYNHNLHTLPIFRFLGDLQHENLATNLTLDIQNMIPGLRFYPRISFGSNVLSLASWHFDRDDFTKLFNMQDPVPELRRQLAALGIPNTFRVIEHDNSLFFDNRCNDSMKLLINHLKKTIHVEIKEVLDGSSFVIGSDGLALEHEIIATIINMKPLQPYNNNVQSDFKQDTTQKQFLIGDEWMYFKIYCIHASTNELIATDLYKLVKLLRSKNLIEKWFFIRYSDPEPHIRVRIKMNGRKTDEIIYSFNKIFIKRLRNGSISKIALIPYEREIERYGADLIEEVENVFFISTELVVDFLRKLYLKRNLLIIQNLISTVDLMIDCYSTNLEDKQKLVSGIVQRMKTEFNLDPSNVVLLNERYREAKLIINLSLLNGAKNKLLKQKKYVALKLSIGCLFTHIGENNSFRKEALISDLIHMHINRFLSNDQRMQEFILAYFLKKSYLTLQKKTK